MPTKRFKDFINIKYDRKVVTIEPIIDFDIDIFLNWIMQLKNQNSLEYVWIGFNSKQNQVILHEPSNAKVNNFITILKENNINIIGKDLRNIKIDF